MPEFQNEPVRQKQPGEGAGIGRNVQATAEHLAKLKGENPAQPSKTTIDGATKIVVENDDKPQA